MADSVTILHADIDAFYAAVEVRERPELAGRPVVVGADPQAGRGRGVVAAASYEARRYGIHSAMPISRAYQLCPRAVFVRPRMGFYVAVSRSFMAVLGRYTDLVEPLSIDEAFLDVTASRELFGDGAVIAKRIKEEVRSELRLTVSVGVAPVKFVAKIASDLRKPDALVVVRPGEVREFLAPLPLHRLWGAGAKSVARLEALGARTIGDLARMPAERLAEAVGLAAAEHFRALALGIDERTVTPEREEKSIGHETTFPEDVADRAVVSSTLFELTEHVAQRVRQAGLRGRIVTVKLRTSDFRTVTRRETLPAAVDTVEEIWPVAKKLLGGADTTRLAIRLVGVSLSGFAAADQLPLFSSPVTAQRRRVAEAMDQLQKRFGHDAVRHAGPGTPRRGG